VNIDVAPTNTVSSPRMETSVLCTDRLALFEKARRGRRPFIAEQATQLLHDFARPLSLEQNWSVFSRRGRKLLQYLIELPQEWVEYQTTIVTTNALQSITDGGEGGIRTLSDHLESVSYRKHVARNAVVTVAHCPRLPARVH